VAKKSDLVPQSAEKMSVQAFVNKVGSTDRMSKEGELEIQN
jgi:hypothetical protein